MNHMTKIYFTLLLFIFSAPLNAQGVLTGDAIKNIQFTDANGRLLPMGQSSVEGSPYVFDKFGMGNILFSNGTKAEDSSLNYSYFDHKLYFTKNNQLYLVSIPVKEFQLSNTDEDNNIVKKYFVSGYPNIDNNNAASFYEKLAQGPHYQLLKYTHKRIKETNVYGGNPIKEYAVDQLYCLFFIEEQKMVSIGNNLTFKNLKKSILSQSAKLDEIYNTIKSTFKNEVLLYKIIEML